MSSSLATAQSGPGDRLFAAGRRCQPGAEALAHFHELALTDINMRCAARTIAGPQPYLQMPLQGARALRELILADGSLTEVGLDQLLAAFGEMIADPAVYATWFNVMQVWGRKAKT